MSDRKQVASSPNEARSLEHLREAEAANVLRTILKSHPDLIGEAEALARSLLGAVSSDNVAEAVENAILALYLEDLDRYPGRTRYDHFEPTKAASWVLGDTVRPFIEDITRRAESGQIDPALATCAGVVLGLYRLSDCKRGELLEYAPNFPSETAEDAVVALRNALLTARTSRGARPSSSELPSIL